MSNLGFNTGYIEELYRQYLEDPSSVGESWQDFFQDFTPDEGFVAAETARPVPTPPPAAETGRQDETVSPTTATSEKKAPAPSKPTPDADEKALRGPQAKIAENMEASLGIPTATSVRTVPVKLMAENRALINDHQRYVGGDKVSFTHIIAFALVRALKHTPGMNAAFREDDDGTLYHVTPNHVNVGLAIDIERRGKRSLLVPNIKKAETLNFAQLLGTYNDLVRRARDNKLEISDFEGTTVSITNPGMIGTGLSVPRLMPGQGLILGIGSIGYPPEYYAFSPDVMGKTGVSQVMTLTSTYDHRVIQGAESGAFLERMEQLLRGEHGFYESIFADLGIQTAPWRLTSDSTPGFGQEVDSTFDMIHKQAAVLQLIRAYRVRGHLQADVNPLGYEWVYHKELDPASYGLTIWDLDRQFVTGGLSGTDMLPLRDILDILRRTYTRRVGIEFMHISDPDEKRWLQERIEPNGSEYAIGEAEKRRMLEKLNAAEAFETFLHTKYIGHKRFSLEGSETVIPMLDRILSDAADKGVNEVVMGMAHRGRLNVLANIMEKPYEVIFSEFEGNIDPTTTQGSGDVKYHLGSKSEHKSPGGASIKLQLSSNPSHLEAVDPIVEGMVRAKQEARIEQHHDNPDADYLDSVIPVLIHGDAAFAGQGVVAETLHLSQLPGYMTGGTIHIVINNQIGFTTGPAHARSSTYATDSARMIQAPIFHVNGDDPEACVRVARLALEYRQLFNKDVVIDMLCYRVRGHNEGDEPTYTQPLLYQRIESKRSPRKMYTELLLRRGDMTPEDAEQMLDDYRSRLQDAFERTKELAETSDASSQNLLAERTIPELPVVETAAKEEDLLDVVRALSQLPEDFHTHNKLVRQFERREKLYREERKIDWGFGEALAYGSLLLEGVRIRMSGQDTRRGTFSHRHAVLYDQETAEEYIPLNNIRPGQANLYIYDSLLSEYAACAFEYGYSVADPHALVIWEAQFGDFANGAQIVYDQFLSAAEAKWGQTSSMVLLLPHGYEGQGPEHSSARLERFLQLCAENNLIVANLSTPANLFHAMRRQASSDIRKPLVIMSPKSLLRHPKVISEPSEFTHGAFQPVIPAASSPGAPEPAKAERLVFCSGKVYYDLLEALESGGSAEGGSAAAGSVAIARVEQFYPFPADAIRAELEKYSQVKDVYWLQEEPENMGAWSFLRHRMDDVLAEVFTDGRRVKYAGRKASASPATGSSRVHQAQQQALLETVLKV
ncbi:MAG: multifunctional oxoglutarate decarboxylase/oxoglutarate dehydrogenase thiamine pyrophosphate-binding subunit/dihydrolipoyllysine-residue succinyltransferase subunit [Rhodothermales bacterium]